MSGRHARGPKPPRFLFHPFELAVCGRSGAGKTTLLERLLERFSRERRVGYAKHDAHRFDFDREGKDTWRLGRAGAAAVHVHDPSRAGLLRDGPLDPLLAPTLFAGCDFVLVEGFRRELRLPKLLFVDGLEGEEPHEDVVACVTADSTRTGRPASAALLDDSCREAPVFHRDDLDGLADFVLGLFEARLAARPLKGLLLTGGRSERMGHDKALIAYRGEPEALRAARLLEEVLGEVFVSVRPGQEAERAAIGRPLLTDRHLEMGPLGGILSALDSDPAAAWLVLGCDLPFADERTLRTLLDGRNPWAVATAFDSASDGLPEPLCAVWEPRSRQRVLGFLAKGLACPRQVLLRSAIRRLPAQGQALANVNRPEEAEAARLRLASEPGALR